MIIKNDFHQDKLDVSGGEKKAHLCQQGALRTREGRREIKSEEEDEAISTPNGRHDKERRKWRVEECREEKKT